MTAVFSPTVAADQPSGPTGLAESERWLLRGAFRFRGSVLAGLVLALTFSAGRALGAPSPEAVLLGAMTSYGLTIIVLTLASAFVAHLLLGWGRRLDEARAWTTEQARIVASSGERAL